MSHGKTLFASNGRRGERTSPVAWEEPLKT